VYYEVRVNSAAKLTVFEQTVLPHLNAAYNLARWLTRNDHDAEDITQEAYLRAFRYFDSFQGGDGKAWLLAIVRNTCQTWRRRETVMPKVTFDELSHSRPAATPEQDLIETAESAGVRNCLESLPGPYREVLVMRELEDMPYKEIADATALPIGTVMSRLSRARQRLLDCVTHRMTGATR